MAIELFDCVETLVDLSGWCEHPPEDSPVLPKGSLCAVVEIFSVPNLAYEIELVGPDGSGMLATATPEQIRHIKLEDVPEEESVQ